MDNRFKIISSSTEEYRLIHAKLAKLRRLFWIEADGEIEVSYPCGVITLKPVDNGRIKYLQNLVYRFGEIVDCAFDKIDFEQGTVHLVIGEENYLIYFKAVPDLAQLF